jgi:hypothetical protein
MATDEIESMNEKRKSWVGEAASMERAWKE